MAHTIPPPRRHGQPGRNVERTGKRELITVSIWSRDLENEGGFDVDGDLNWLCYTCRTPLVFWEEKGIYSDRLAPKYWGMTRLRAGDYGCYAALAVTSGPDKPMSVTLATGYDQIIDPSLTLDRKGFSEFKLKLINAHKPYCSGYLKIRQTPTLKAFGGQSCI